MNVGRRQQGGGQCDWSRGLWVNCGQEGRDRGKWDQTVQGLESLVDVCRQRMQEAKKMYFINL